MIGRGLLLGVALGIGIAAVAALAASPPLAGPVVILATGIDGPEGITVDRSGGVIVGETNGDVVRVTADGVVHPYASTGERLAGLGASGGLAFLSSGSDTEMEVPRPTSLWISISPSWRRTMPYTLPRPSPVPLSSFVE